jgi:hypothetical protein
MQQPPAALDPEVERLLRPVPLTTIASAAPTAAAIVVAAAPAASASAPVRSRFGDALSSENDRPNKRPASDDLDDVAAKRAKAALDDASSKKGETSDSGLMDKLVQANVQMQLLEREAEQRHLEMEEMKREHARRMSAAQKARDADFAGKEKELNSLRREIGDIVRANQSQKEHMDQERKEKLKKQKAVEGYEAISMCFSLLCEEPFEVVGANLDSIRSEPKALRRLVLQKGNVEKWNQLYYTMKSARGADDMARAGGVVDTTRVKCEAHKAVGCAVCFQKKREALVDAWDEGGYDDGDEVDVEM